VLLKDIAYLNSFNYVRNIKTNSAIKVHKVCTVVRGPPADQIKIKTKDLQ